jgi:hypothetical protein
MSGSPNPPKKIDGFGFRSARSSKTSWKVSGVIKPIGSPQALRMQVRQARLQRLVGSI